MQNLFFVVCGSCANNSTNKMLTLGLQKYLLILYLLQFLFLYETFEILLRKKLSKAPKCYQNT